jgi:hypothetical protein
MKSRGWSAIRNRIFSKWFVPLWVLALGLIALAAGAGGAVGPILSGFISGGAGLVVEQSVVIDRENFNTDDILSGITDKLVTFNDEGSSFTVAAEMHTGDDLVIDVPLTNRSEFNANMIASVEVDGAVQHDVEVFWNTLTRSDSPTVSNSSPSPSPQTSTDYQSSDTAPSTTTFPGVAGINAQVSNGTPTNSSPGLPVSIPQTDNSVKTNTQPTGSASVSAKTANAGTKTTTQPTGSASVTAQTSNGSKTTTQPTGSIAISSKTSNGTKTTTQPTGSVTINAKSANSSKTTTQPTGSAAIIPNFGDGLITGIQPSGSAPIVATTTQTAATTTQPSGSVAIAANSADSSITHSQPSGSVTILATTTQGTATTTQPSGAPISQSSVWYIGSNTIDTDGDGVTDDTLNFALTDTSVSGTYDTLDLSLGDTTFNEGNTSDANVDAAGDDERTTATSSVITFGSADLEFTTEFSSAPLTGSDDLSLTAKTWFTGSLSMALNDDGLVNDTVNFALSDSDSNGTFDTLDLSQDDVTYGTSVSHEILIPGDDERIITSTDVAFGLVNATFTAAFDSDPLSDSDDVRVTSGSWYTGSFTLALNAVGVLSDVVNFALSDSDSNGTFETLDISQDDTTFGETTFGALGDGFVTSGGDDERITSSEDIFFGDVGFEFATAFDINPEEDASDVSLTAKTWYDGAYFFDIAADADGIANDTLNFALSDTDSNGTFETLDLSLNNTTFGQGTLTDSDIDDSTDDERITSTTDIEYGGAIYTATTAFDSNPENDPFDTTLTSKSWYTGSFTLAMDSDGIANDTLNFALIDIDSDGAFDVLDLSLGDSTYGTTTSNGNVDTNDDETIFESTDVVYGAADHTFTTEFDNNPVADTNDVRLTSDCLTKESYPR